MRASPHPEVGYELKPNLDLLFKMRPFQTSPAGLRDEPYPEAKPPGTYRIAVLGDSFTMGSGVALEDTYHSRLERLLAEGSEGTRYECLNFGVAGYGLMNYVGTLRHRALRYAPDLILVGLTANDRSAQRARALDDFGDAVEEEGLGFFFRFHCLDDAWRRLTGGGEPVSGEGAGRRQRGGRHLFLRESFAVLAELGRRSGAPVVPVYLNMRQDAASLETGELFAEIAAESGLELLDTSALFADRDIDELVIFPNDYHPNEAAHALFAGRIAEWLRRE